MNYWNLSSLCASKFDGSFPENGNLKWKTVVHFFISFHPEKKITWQEAGYPKTDDKSLKIKSTKWTHCKQQFFLDNLGICLKIY